MDTTKVHFGEPICFVEVTYRNTGESLLMGIEMVQRQLYLQNPPQHGWQLTKLGAWSIQHSLQAVEQVGESPFQVPPLVWPLPCSCFRLRVIAAFLLWLVNSALLRILLTVQLYFLPEGHSAFIVFSGREGQNDSDQFQGLSETVLSFLPSCLGSFPCKMKCFNLRLNC